MRAHRRRRIGVFIEWLSDGYSDPILEEIVSVAEERGVDIRCFVGGCHRLDFPVARRHFPLVYASRHSIDGAVVVSLGNHVSASNVETLFERFEGMPLCSMAVRWNRYPSIEVDNTSGVRAGVRHLIKTHGRRKIACIRGPAKSIEADERFAAYRDVLSEFGLEYDDRYVAVGSYMRQHGATAVRVFLDERNLVVDAIVAANDAMALGAMEELERRGIDVPESVALLGFDDVEEARHARPPLSTVRQPFRDHARGAFEMVMDQLDGKTVPRHTMINSQLVLRRSCGCVSSRGWMASSVPPAPSSPREGLDAWVRSCSNAWVEFFAPRADAENLRQSISAAMLRAARSGELGFFLDLLDCELDRLGRTRGDVLLVLPLLRSQQKALRGVEATGPQCESLDNLFSAAAALASDVAQRLEAHQRHNAKTQINRLLRMNEALMRTTNVDALAQVLVEQLPHLGVRGCYVCVWEGQAVPAQWARLVAACDVNGARQLPPGGWRFKPEQLLPAGLGFDDRPSSWLICPMLRLEPNTTSYIVLWLGTAEAFVYDALVDQVGSNWKRLDLMQQLEVANRQLRAMAHTDALTQLHNRRHLMDEFNIEFKRARRHHLDLSFAILDLDHFKRVNDTYGHLAGDGVLKQVAALLAGGSRCTDLVGRYGGEELCLVLGHTSLEDAVLVAEKVRAAIAELEFVWESNEFRITASIGVAQVGSEDQTIEDVIRRADKALYRAKANGRNRVERAQAELE